MPVFAFDVDHPAFHFFPHQLANRFFALLLKLMVRELHINIFDVEQQRTSGTRKELFAPVVYFFVVIPNDFISEVFRPEHGVHEQAQVCARRYIAMQIYAASALEDPSEFHEPRSHHGEVRQHVAFAEYLPKAL